MAEEKFITWLTAIESALDSCSPLVRFSMLKIMKLYHSMMNQGANIHEKALKLVLEIHVVFYNHDEMFNTLMEHTEVTGSYSVWLKPHAWFLLMFTDEYIFLQYYSYSHSFQGG